MAVYTPWQVEMLGAADIPHEAVTTFFMGFFGVIPINRGHADRRAMRQALDVLAQDGVLGIFPEGGIWEGSASRPQQGVAWLSYRSGAPVLPVGFGGTMGALGGALRLERPRLKMRVGEMIPPATVARGEARKPALEAYARKVLQAVQALVPGGSDGHTAVVNERFALHVSVQSQSSDEQPIPAALTIDHDVALAKLLHQPAVLKIFAQNLRLPVAPLQDLENAHDPVDIALGARSILSYLEGENPYLLTYRFGPREGEAMQAGLRELVALAQWSDVEGLALYVTPIRRYYSLERGEEVVETSQGAFAGWM
jgi:1-acyl-sn-glycerol-3-phosphate acyltransferase